MHEALEPPLLVPVPAGALVLCKATKLATMKRWSMQPIAHAHVLVIAMAMTTPAPKTRHHQSTHTHTHTLQPTMAGSRRGWTIAAAADEPARAPAATRTAAVLRSPHTLAAHLGTRLNLSWNGTSK
jgi:hypothetical protein